MCTCFTAGELRFRYSVEDNAVVGKERRIDGAWPGLPTSGIQAASKWPAVEWNDDREKAYFFWGGNEQPSGNDIDREAPDGGFPRTIRDTWPGADLAVWAAVFDVPIVPCLDARLEGKPGGPPYPQGTLRGQGGWDMGLLFTSLNDLAVKDRWRERPEAHRW